MSIGETLLVFGALPLAVILVVTGWAFAADARAAPRYRPGRPFAFTPVWYLTDGSDEGLEPKALPAGRSGRGRPVRLSEPGGARGTW